MKWNIALKLASVVMAVLFARTAFTVPKKHKFGFRETAEFLIRDEYRKRVILCSSQAFGEGMLISEIAERDRARPEHVVLRASRVLASSGWNNEGYRLRFNTPADTMQYLSSVPVGLLVIDRAAPLRQLPHHRLLEETVRGYPQYWRHVARFQGDGNRKPEGTDVYELVGMDAIPRHRIEFDVKGTFRRNLEIAQPN
jgi:hypothetical protein